MFVDRSKIFVTSGHGGDGCLSFRREKYVELGGPDGANGGRGGDVYLIADKKHGSLYDFTKKRHFVADSGVNGKGALKNGKNGEDLYIAVPCGTLVYVYDEENDVKTFFMDLVNHGDKVRVVPGGRGGRGNAAFKTSNRNAPRIVEKGEPGKKITVLLELKLIASIGLLGYPNAGKSTFLSVITKAKPKIADYPFTTIKPNLGVIHYYDKNFVIADIPGIIEGAHKGVGLGFDFLRHVERTNILLHLIDVNGSDDKNIYENFINMNKELQLYSEKLAQKKQIVLITKKDTFFEEDLENRKKIDEFKRKILNVKNVEVLKIFEVSSLSREGLDEFREFLYNIMQTIEGDQKEGLNGDVLSTSLEHNEQIKEFKLAAKFLVKKKDEYFSVKGEEIERIAAMTNFNEAESLVYFQNIIKKMGIDEELKKQGIEEGDLVVIGDFEFYYQK